ncbi:MAG TPA: hypothetical protein VK522_13735 [Pseudolabrys sp.]|nr:hypothetical protein [Pseudolabrys sp.]
MHAVKIADCHDRAMQWPNIQASITGDVEGISVLTDFVHAAISLFGGSGTNSMLNPASCSVFGLKYGYSAVNKLSN